MWDGIKRIYSRNAVRGKFYFLLVLGIDFGGVAPAKGSSKNQWFFVKSRLFCNFVRWSCKPKCTLQYENIFANYGANATDSLLISSLLPAYVGRMLKSIAAADRWLGCRWRVLFRKYDNSYAIGVNRTLTHIFLDMWPNRLPSVESFSAACNESKYHITI